MSVASIKKGFSSMPDNWITKVLRRCFSAIRTSYLFGSAVYDPISLIDGAGVTTTVTVTGAVLGDYVPMVSFSLDTQGITVTAWVSAANTVSVRFQNETTATIDLASGTLRVVVAKAANFNATYLSGLDSPV